MRIAERDVYKTLQAVGIRWTVAHKMSQGSMIKPEWSEFPFCNNNNNRILSRCLWTSGPDEDTSVKQHIMCHCSPYLLVSAQTKQWTLALWILLQGISELFEKIKQENKANGHANNEPGLFFTNLYVTPVLRNISLYLEKGKMLAVAGSTGAGKVSQTLLCVHDYPK